LLIAQEDFTARNQHESFKSYTGAIFLAMKADDIHALEVCFSWAETYQSFTFLPQLLG
jgi:hypothetical protein